MVKHHQKMGGKRLPAITGEHCESVQEGLDLAFLSNT